MKTFLLLLLTIVVAAAAPTSDKNGILADNKPDMKHQKARDYNKTTEPKNFKKMALQLKEIMNNVNALKVVLSKEILHKWVRNTFSNRKCTLEEMHEAGKVLVAFETEALGLPQQHWTLPRLLFIYTEGTHGRDTAEAKINIKLKELLNKIHNCAQNKYLKLNSTSS